VAALALPVASDKPQLQGTVGYDYEEHCAEILRDAGWETRSTPRSGDQGVDIIAERDGISVAIQCKNYKQPVGNKAVQEVLAGKSYEHADLAAVVSPAPYTPAARELASATGVLLLHHQELSDLATRIQNDPYEQATTDSGDLDVRRSRMVQIDQFKKNRS